MTSRRTASGILSAAMCASIALAACTARGPAPVVANQDAAATASASPAARDKAPLTAKDVDAMIRAAWKTEGVTPAAPIDDARWLRRVYLDVGGVIPSADVVSRFIVDTSPDKREKTVDGLLASTRYVEHWTNYWDRLLLGKDVKQALVDRESFRGWLREELAKNVAYDRFVTDLLTATGQNRDDVVLKVAGAAMKDDAAASGKTEPVSGAVNYFIRYIDRPQDLAGTTSKLFLGVEIQCAQCHDHKTEKWKQTDFQKFAACFAETRVQPIDPAALASRRRVEVDDTGRVGRLKKKNEPDLQAIAAAAPTTLDGIDLSDRDNRRQALAKWMTAKENPWFAPALVNRIWAHFLGRGFVDPVTDFRPSNPALAPDVLKALSDDFVEHGYDLHRLVKLITMTEVYGLSPAKESDGVNKLWSKFRVEPLGPDELLDSLVVATNLEGALDRKVFGKSIEEVRAQLDKQFTFLFDVDEDSDAPDFTGTIPQALFLLNGQATNGNTRAVPGSTLAEVLDLGDDDAKKITALYLRALSRPPTTDEIATFTEFVNAPREIVNPNGEPVAVPKRKGKKGAPDAQVKGRKAQLQARRQAYEDLFWALLNSSEFAFNH